jgi:hypothetical protein
MIGRVRMSKKHLMAVACAIMAGSMLPLSAVHADTPSDRALATLMPDVQTAMNRGALLYIYDEAAWHGTDELVANHKKLSTQTGGYVVTGTQQDTQLVFYNKEQTRAVYRAVYRNQKLAGAGPPPAGQEALTDLERQLIRAREIATQAFVAAKVSICTKGKPNLAVLPPATAGDPAIVYLMSSRVDMEEVPLGGHYSVTVSADGRVGPIRKFTNGCVNLPLNVKDKNGGKLVAGNITHLLDPTPTEIHVFSSLTSHLPIYVLTVENKRIWKVDGATITFTDSLPDRK